MHVKTGRSWSPGLATSFIFREKLQSNNEGFFYNWRIYYNMKLITIEIGADESHQN